MIVWYEKKISLLGSLDQIRLGRFLFDILKDIFTLISILEEVMTVFSRSMQEIHGGTYSLRKDLGIVSL